MLFQLFQLGKDRYAIEAKRIVEVVPLLHLKKVPQSPPGFAGIFIYRGRPVPAIDLCQVTLGQPAAERLSTRIIIVQYPDRDGGESFLGLIAEKATEMLRKEAKDFVDSGFQIGSTPYLGPILLDAEGPIQWVRERHLLSEQVRGLILGETALVTI
jgi:chemotaxis-related protein WspB